MTTEQPPTAPTPDAAQPANPVPPGWYADGATPDLDRWWSGTAWTEHTRPRTPTGNTAHTPNTSRMNGFGITALILSIPAFFLGLLPFLGWGTWFLGVMGVVFGIIGLTRRGLPKVAAIIGTIASAIAILTSLIAAALYTGAFATSVNQSLNGLHTHTVEYVVTGDGSAADMNFDIVGASGSNSVSGTYKIPFDKTFKFTERGAVNFNAFSVTANYPITLNGNSGSDLTCDIIVDGKKVSHDEASGEGAFVTCSGSSQ